MIFHAACFMVMNIEREVKLVGIGLAFGVLWFLVYLVFQMVVGDKSDYYPYLGNEKYVSPNTETDESCRCFYTFFAGICNWICMTVMLRCCSSGVSHQPL